MQAICREVFPYWRDIDRERNRLEIHARAKAIHGSKKTAQDQDEPLTATVKRRAVLLHPNDARRDAAAVRPSEFPVFVRAPVS